MLSQMQKIFLISSYINVYFHLKKNTTHMNTLEYTSISYYITFIIENIIYYRRNISINEHHDMQI